MAAMACILVILHDTTASRDQTCTSDVCRLKAAATKTKGISKMSSAAAVTVQDFDEKVLKAEGPVLVDFWAPWCMPCKMLGPILDELAEDYSGKVAIVKVNTDENQALAAKYGIRGIPTLILFKDGEMADRISGLQSKGALTEMLDKVVEE